MPEPFIIAELAQGFEGKPAQAMALVQAAAAAGADAAKLQLVYAEELATPDYKHFKLFKNLEMPDAVWRELAGRARELSLELHLDVFGARSLRLAEGIGAQAVKVHSTDMGNPGLLTALAESRVEQALLSTGGCTAAEIERALEILSGKRVVLLHGFQGYPTPVEANQIQRLREFAARYQGRAQIRLGFADHADPESALSLVLPAAALGTGAEVLEKHLTLAKVLKLEDHESALNPDEFSAFVRHMRDCARALGAAAGPRASAPPRDFAMHESELAYRNQTRKHVVAARPLAAGAVIAAADVALKRTSSTQFMQDAGAVIGRRLARAVKADEAIAPQALESSR
jgi:N,N'-diacetyllegionaminate synthase